MNIPTNVPKEISLLAEHHKAVLESRFPDYDYGYEMWDADWLRFMISERGAAILSVLFSSNHVRVVVYPPGNFDLEEEINYTDPRFTDDFLSDILKRLVR